MPSIIVLSCEHAIMRFSFGHKRLKPKILPSYISLSTVPRIYWIHRKRTLNLMKTQRDLQPETLTIVYTLKQLMRTSFLHGSEKSL